MAATRKARVTMAEQIRLINECRLHCPWHHSRRL